MKKLVPFLSIFTFLIMGLLGAVLAYFTVSVVSQGNMISSAEMTAEISDNDENGLTAVSSSWSATDLFPGDTMPEGRVMVTNTSSIDADHVDIEFSYTGSDDIARNLIFTNNNNGLRFHSTTNLNGSVNLITALKGGSDVDYTVLQADGSSISASTIDGADGTVEDGLLSLSELAAFGKFRIAPGNHVDGIAAGTSAYLYLNGEMSEDLTAQGESIDLTVTVSFDQDSSQL